MKGEFEKFTLADNISSRESDSGIPYAINPDKTNSKVYIMVATNYEGSAYLLDPISDTSYFEYEKDLIVNTDGYVSSLATYDIDGDGW